MSVQEDDRKAFIDQLRIMGKLGRGAAVDRVLEAFRQVPRERFVGPGPWILHAPHAGRASIVTPDDDPRHLYQCVLIVLDEIAGINIGEPSLWAKMFVKLNIHDGCSVLQIGAGTGYYTAILARLVGSGRVLAFEAEKHLADMAARNLACIGNVELRHGNGATDLMPQDGAFDLIVAFAGVTHPVGVWCKHLLPTGRMLLPVTGLLGWGAMVLLENADPVMEASTLGACGFYPCQGARDDDLAARIDGMWLDRRRTEGHHLQLRMEGDETRYLIDGQVF
ncbi:MAG: methyltransferase domain-containing protein [Lautropia sp.]|nr:methyltransferase domain-containing protein [Lautropia sp.]